MSVQLLHTSMQPKQYVSTCHAPFKTYLPTLFNCNILQVQDNYKSYKMPLITNLFDAYFNV